MCQEWLVDTGYCFAGGLASVTESENENRHKPGGHVCRRVCMRVRPCVQVENGAVYAAAPVAESAGWAYMYKEDHDEEFPNEVRTERMCIDGMPGCVDVWVVPWWCAVCLSDWRCDRDRHHQ